MGDLISRQAVIDIIHKEINKTSTFSEHDTQINIEMAVRALPTAYDVENVVAELEEIYSKTFTMSPIDAIEIVRKGGTD